MRQFTHAQAAFGMSRTRQLPFPRAPRASPEMTMPTKNGWFRKLVAFGESNHLQPGFNSAVRWAILNFVRQSPALSMP
jgi:hypothetical protein